MIWCFIKLSAPNVSDFVSWVSYGWLFYFALVLYDSILLCFGATAPIPVILFSITVTVVVVVVAATVIFIAVSLPSMCHLSDALALTTSLVWLKSRDWTAKVIAHLMCCLQGYWYWYRHSTARHPAASSETNREIWIEKKRMKCTAAPICQWFIQIMHPKRHKHISKPGRITMASASAAITVAMARRHNRIERHKKV